jgi:hypothetical protein
MFARTRLLIVTLWVGSLWTVGYLVAPTLFATLADRMLAGTIAGNIFRTEAWLSVVCALLLFLLAQVAPDIGNGAERKRIFRLVAAMLVCTLIGYFCLQPFMAALREGAGPGGVMESASRIRFGILHGVASALYLIQSLLGVALVLKVR